MDVKMPGPRQEALKRFTLAVDELRERFKDMPQSELEALIEEAIAAARRRSPDDQAD